MRPRCRRRRAFTLLELLVVVGIMAVFVSFLMPSLQRVRFQGRTTACAANLRQMTLALQHYAAANDRQWPRFDMPGTGRNLWDVSHGFVNTLRRDYGLRYEAFWCPTAEQTMADQTFAVYGSFYIVGYNVWAPRLNGTVTMPPLRPGDPPYTYPQPTSPEPFAGPRGPADRLAATNPVFTDIVGSNMAVTPPADADPSVPRNPYQLTALTTHQSGGVFRDINAAYADGRVENIPAQRVRPRYAGNCWNWR